MFGWTIAAATAGFAAFKQCRRLRFFFDHDSKEKVSAQLAGAYVALDDLSLEQAFRQILRWLTWPVGKRTGYVLASLGTGLCFVLLAYVEFASTMYQTPDAISRLLSSPNLRVIMLSLALATLVGYLLMSFVVWRALRYLATSEPASWNKVLLVVMAVAGLSYIVFGFIVALLSSSGLAAIPLSHGHFVPYFFSRELLWDRWWKTLLHPLTPLFTIQLNPRMLAETYWMVEPQVIFARPLPAPPALGGVALAWPALIPVLLLLVTLLFALWIARAHRSRKWAVHAVLRLHNASEYWRDRFNFPISKMCMFFMLAMSALVVVLALGGL
jgi:hypothetical protein